ncbi:hypothetical protein F3089_03525 [Halospina sp. K52047b]|nr:hypothetical protein F3089_03525 [Halospina sp. K52047b]
MHMEGSTRSGRLNRLAPAAMLLAVLGSTADTWWLTLDRWTKLDESYSHGFLLLVVSLVLSWQVWRRERPVTGLHSLWLFPFVLGLAGYAVGDLLGPV